MTVSNKSDSNRNSRKSAYHKPNHEQTVAQEEKSVGSGRRNYVRKNKSLI